MQNKCPVCSSEASVAVLDNKLSLSQCDSCDHTFTANFQEEAEEIYSKDYYEDDHKNWFDNPNIPLFKFIHSQMRLLGRKSRIRVLDVGCGRGDFLKFIKHNDDQADLWGIDLTANTYQGISFTDVTQPPARAEAGHKRYGMR